MKVLWLSICVALLLPWCSRPQNEPIHRQLDGWADSSPEEQGMDRARLAALDTSLADEHGNIDGMLVIRNGRVVYEKHYSREYDGMNEGLGQAPGLYNYHDPEWHPFYQRGELHTIWNQVRMLPEGWVGESVERRVEDTGWRGMGYGYQWWLVPWGSDEDSFAYAAIGYGGQRLLVVPELDLVAVFTGWNIDDFPALDPRFALDAVLAAVDDQPKR
jgi:CubicO group peptidase (beta-lactamase class C family)